MDNDLNKPTTVKIGFIPLIDCAPFVIAKEKGLFLANGVDVLLTKEASWASIRDKVAFNILDGAHMLASMPLAASLGVGTVKAGVHTSFIVSHNGNGITVSRNLHEQMSKAATSPEEIKSGVALKRLISQRGTTLEPLRFAIVYPYSLHNYQLRDWLDKADIDPDKDVQIIVIPPTQMIDYLKLGDIDGYCVGEPWNSLAENQGVGQMVTTGYEIWGSTPEKVLGVNSRWAEQHHQAHLGVISALYSACQWVSAPSNQNELIRILSHPDYLNCPEEQLACAFKTNDPFGESSSIDLIKQRFYGEHINQPVPSHALWIMAQMYRWQQLAYVPALNDVAEQVYQQTSYFEALEQPLPPDYANWKLTAEQQQTWLTEVESGVVHGAITGNPPETN